MIGQQLRTWPLLTVSSSNACYKWSNEHTVGCVTHDFEETARPKDRKVKLPVFVVGWLKGQFL